MEEVAEPFIEQIEEPAPAANSAPPSPWPKLIPNNTVADPFTSAITEVIPHDTRMAVLQAAGIDPEPPHYSEPTAGSMHSEYSENQHDSAGSAVQTHEFEHPTFKRPIFKHPSEELESLGGIESPVSDQFAIPPNSSEVSSEQALQAGESHSESAPTSFRERLKRQDTSETAVEAVAISDSAAEEIQYQNALTRAQKELSARKRLRAYGLPIILLFAAVMIYIGKDLAASRVFVPKPSVPITEVTSASPKIGEIGYLPTFSPDSVVTFPILPGGVYSGTISRLIAHEVLPFTIISFPESRTLTVMIGVEGWTPRSISLETHDNLPNSETVRVASNGFILDFSAEPIETTNLSNDISGSFKNVITGETGTWKVKPVK